jgi:Ca-activated chloride channel homolog
MGYSASLFAQAENQSIKNGNDNYNNKNFAGAASDYQSALAINPKSDPANYNLGNALFGQENFDTAIAQFSQVAETTADPSIRAQAYHNLGNAELMKKEYEKSVDAYKKALRSNPDDMDTKYNLAYAQKKLQQQQQQNKDQNKQDQNKKDQNKDQQKQDQKKQDQKKDQQNQQNKDQQAQQQPKKYSKEDMERIMQALNNEDKKTQDKLNKQKMTPQKITIDKDW